MLNNNRLGFCSWSVRPENIDELISSAKQIGLARIQLALNPLCDDGRAWWNAALRFRDAGITVKSGMFGTVGEDYASIARIHETGGVLPDETWPASWTNLHIAAPLAAALGIERITMHAGFIPSDTSDPVYDKVLNRIGKVADLLGGYGIDVALETGQEAAPTLKNFFTALGRKNAGINFDPANMILYGSGDPIAALELLLPHVHSVHLKDAKASSKPGVEWGEEVPLGEGQVDWQKFFALLTAGEFAGEFNIEREAGDQRILDIRGAVEMLGKQ